MNVVDRSLDHVHDENCFLAPHDIQYNVFAPYEPSSLKLKEGYSRVNLPANHTKEVREWLIKRYKMTQPRIVKQSKCIDHTQCKGLQRFLCPNANLTELESIWELKSGAIKGQLMVEKIELMRTIKINLEKINKHKVYCPDLEVERRDLQRKQWFVDGVTIKGLNPLTLLKIYWRQVESDCASDHYEYPEFHKVNYPNISKPTGHPDEKLLLLP